MVLGIYEYPSLGALKPKLDKLEQKKPREKIFYK